METIQPTWLKLFGWLRTLDLQAAQSKMSRRAANRRRTSLRLRPSGFGPQQMLHIR
jgi:hypothetical protein